jgi:hypothetical protein
MFNRFISGIVVGSVVASVAAFMVLTLMGCAPQTPISRSNKATSSIDAYSLLNDDGSWDCPSYANVISKNDYDSSSYESFVVCRSLHDPNRFKISGKSRAVEVCAFPFNGSATYEGIVATPKCFNPKAIVEVVFDKPARPINRMVIVDANYTNQYLGCLSSNSSGGTTTCKTYSEGPID